MREREEIKKALHEATEHYISGGMSVIDTMRKVLVALEAELKKELPHRLGHFDKIMDEAFAKEKAEEVNGK